MTKVTKAWEQWKYARVLAHVSVPLGDGWQSGGQALPSFYVASADVGTEPRYALARAANLALTARPAGSVASVSVAFLADDGSVLAYTTGAYEIAKDGKLVSASCGYAQGVPGA